MLASPQQSVNSLAAGQTHPLVAAAIPPHYNVYMCIDVSQVNSQYALERQMDHMQQRAEKVTLKILSLDESMIQIHSSRFWSSQMYCQSFARL